MASVRSMIVLALIALLAGAAFQGSRGLFESTEGRYALCAREMADSGRLLEPTLLDHPHWTKPPLEYWTIIAGMRVFGRNAWGARAFNVLAFVVTTLLVAGIAAAMMQEARAGIVAGLVYATSLYPVAIAWTLNTDTVLTMWETLAVFCYWRGLRCLQPDVEGADSAHRRMRWWNLGFWGALGLAFMTKGPPGLMPLAPVIVVSVVRRRRGEPTSQVFSLPGLLLFLAIGTWWYLLESWRHPGLLSYFLGKEVVARVATDTFHRNPEWYRPFTMYVPCLLFGGGLWSIFLWKELIARRVWRKPFWNDLLARDGAPLFLAAWVIIPFVIFSVSRSRMLTYVLPLYAPLAIVSARAALRAAAGTPCLWGLPRRVAIVAGVSLTLVVAGKGLTASLMPPRREDMGRLYSLCREYDGPRTALILFEEHRQLGLGYYARGRVFRVRTRKARGIIRDAAELVRELTDGNAPWSTLVFICRRDRNREAMLDFLRRQGLIPADIHEDPNWTVAVIPLDR